MLDLPLAFVAALTVSAATYQANSAGPPPPFTVGDDRTGSCVAFRMCDDWDCPNGDGSSGCYPCSSSADHIEFCGGDTGPGCDDTIIAGGCGEEQWGNCTANGCVIGGDTGDDCSSRHCTEDATAA